MVRYPPDHGKLFLQLPALQLSVNLECSSVVQITMSDQMLCRQVAMVLISSSSVLSQSSDSNSDSDTSSQRDKPFFGIAMLLGSCSVAALQYVFEEKVTTATAAQLCRLLLMPRRSSADTVVRAGYGRDERSTSGAGGNGRHLGDGFDVGDCFPLGVHHSRF